MSIAETGGATETIVDVQVEETRLALPAAFALHVLLAVARPGVGVAVGVVIQRSGHRTAAVLATVRTEIVVVGIAAVALKEEVLWWEKKCCSKYLISRNSRFALALALRVALETPGSCGIAATSHAVVVFTLVIVFSASLAVGAITVGSAVQTMATVAGATVQVFVEVAAVGEAVAVAFCRREYGITSLI